MPHPKKRPTSRRATPRVKRAVAKAARKTKPKTAAQKMRDYRARMRARGFKLVQVWVPDTGRPGFADEIKRQIEKIRGSRSEREAIEFLDAVAQDSDDWK